MLAHAVVQLYYWNSRQNCCDEGDSFFLHFFLLSLFSVSSFITPLLPSTLFTLLPLLSVAPSFCTEPQYHSIPLFPIASWNTCHVIYRLLLSYVTEPPRSLYLAVDGRRLDPGNLFLPVKEGAELAVSCVVEGGHPPASLVWLLTPHHSPGLNTSGSTHPHISEAHLGAVLRAYHNSTVTCLAKHQALTHPLNQSLQLHVQCK